MSKPLRSMRVKELLQMVAKFGVDIDGEKE